MERIESSCMISSRRTRAMSKKESPYENLVVVITGASSGFGRGTALELARRGSRVIAAARSTEKLRELELESQALPGEISAVTTDVSDAAQIESLAAAAIARFGRYDVWINNAGVAAIGRFDQVPLEDHFHVIKTDLLGTIAGSHIAMRYFRDQGGGILINVASVLGKIPAPLYASYAAAKFGVVGLCDALRQDLRQDELEDIRVCTVMPMAHDTDFFEHAANYTGHEAVPIPPTYDPQVTIDKLVDLCINPEDEVITGWQGKVANVLHKLLPGAVEKFMAINTESAQLGKAALDPAAKPRR